MASSFIYQDVDIGVLTASRVAPVAVCTQRVVEPLHPAAEVGGDHVVPAAGDRQTLAVANVHAINFSLTLGTYEAQLAALADALADARRSHRAGRRPQHVDRRTRGRGARARRAALGLVEITYGRRPRARCSSASRSITCSCAALDGRVGARDSGDLVRPQSGRGGAAGTGGLISAACCRSRP